MSNEETRDVDPTAPPAENPELIEISSDENEPPALADDASEDNAESSDEGDASPSDDDSEESAEPESNFAGDYTPNPNVSETLKVIEEVSDEELKILSRDGALLLSNLESEELFKLEALVRGRIERGQLARRKLAEKGAADNYVAIEIPTPRGMNIIWMTKDERDLIEILTIYSRNARSGGETNLFTDGSQWTNLPSIGDNKIAMGMQNNSNSKDPIAVLRHKLNLSNEHVIPLWATGMHVTIQGPSVSEQLALETKLLLEKIDYGRDSNGYIYSASSVYLNRIVADFILSRVTSSTSGITNVDALKDLILLTDLEPLTLGAASTIFPKGYELQRPCVKEQGGCGFVIRRKVNLRRMLFVSNSKLTDDALRLMSKRSGRVDVETIKNYQEQMRPDISRMIKLKDDLYLRLRVPTIAAYERVAGAWMDNLTNRSKELIASRANEQERASYMQRASGVALMMAYGHWVDAFVQVSDDGVDEPKEIVARKDSSNKELQYKSDVEMDKLLEEISGDSDLTDRAIEGISKFIADMTIATVAVPKAVCPSCHKPLPGDETSKHPHLVNINPIDVFFTLLHHKIVTARG